MERLRRLRISAIVANIANYSVLVYESQMITQLCVPHVSHLRNLILPGEALDGANRFD